MFDVLIIGGGVSGMQCALVLGSGLSKSYAQGKKVGIVLHQRASHLQNALFNNVLGLPAGTTGQEILAQGVAQLKSQYPELHCIEKEKVSAVHKNQLGYTVSTNKQRYTAKIVVIALNYAKPLAIEGLESFITPHQRANPAKDRIQLQNQNHLVQPGMYVCGTIAGWRSQFSIAAGSGASVATDILTLWNNNTPTKVHDKI